MNFTDQKGYGFTFRRAKALEQLGIPSGTDLPTLTADYTGGISLFFNTADNSLYKTDGLTWTVVTAGGVVNPPAPYGSFINSGTYTWTGTGLVFDAINYDYQILGVPFAPADVQKTHAAADATFSRIDTVYGDDTNSIGILTGVPSASPVKPQVDPSSQIELAFVIVEAGAVVPSGITNQVFYDEGAEATNSSTIPGIDYVYTVNPLSGLNSTYAPSFTTGLNLAYQKASSYNATDYQGGLLFNIRLGATWATGTFFTVYLYNGTTATTTGVNVTSGNYGFNRTTINAWQTISIPLAAFGLLNNTFNKVHFRTNGSTASPVQIDNVRMQTGTSSPGVTGVTSFNLRQGGVMPAAGDYVSRHANLAAFPAAGDSAKLYYAIDSKILYSWDGAAYQFISSGGGAGWSAVDATEAVKGIAEIATTAEVATGTDDTRIVSPLKLKEVTDTKADLVGGLVPVGQLPGFLNDVLEVANFAALPGTGEAGIIYITIDDNLQWRWTGTIYVNTGGSQAPLATESVSGIAEIATQAEVNTGTDDARIVTALKLATLIAAGLEVLFYANAGAFPGTGAAGKLYVDKAANLLYWWDTVGLAYEVLGGGGGGGGVWGTITGSPADQTDIQNATLQTTYTPGAGTVAIGDTLKGAIQKLDGNITDVGTAQAVNTVGNKLVLHSQFR